MKKSIFYSLYIAIVIYSLAGLMPLSRLGGPCNGGLIIIFLGPAILIISLIHFLLLRHITIPGKKANIVHKILSILCTVFWALWTFAFFMDDPKRVSIYMLPFLILSLALTLMTMLKLSAKFMLRTD